jgi:hypothetical protein
MVNLLWSTVPLPQCTQHRCLQHVGLTCRTSCVHDAFVPSRNRKHIHNPSGMPHAHILALHSSAGFPRANKISCARAFVLPCIHSDGDVNELAVDIISPSLSARRLPHAIILLQRAKVRSFIRSDHSPHYETRARFATAEELLYLRPRAFSWSSSLVTMVYAHVAITLCLCEGQTQPVSFIGWVHL